MIPGINEVQTLATKYSKAQLAQMAQNGLIDPTKAVMAGMMIDRISKQNMEPPKSTVAQDVMAPPAPQMGMQQGQPQQAPSAGVAGIPAPNMESMAGGGIVAFNDGGDVPGYADRGFVMDPAFQIDPQAQAQRDEIRKNMLLQELKTAQNAGDTASVSMLQREISRMKPAPTFASKLRQGVEALIPSAAAAERGYIEDPMQASPVRGAPRTIPELAPPTRSAQPTAPTVPTFKPQAEPGLGSLVPKEEKLLPPVDAVSEKTEAPPLTAPVFKPELLTGRGFDVTQDKARADEFATAYGVDPEYFKKQRDKLEKEGEEIPKEKEQAKWMSLAEAGLAIASGDSQYALQNIARGGSKGLEAYKGYQKDIKEKQRLLKDREARISEAEQLERRGQSAAAQVRRDKAMEHDDRIAEINAKAMSEAEKNNLQATFSVQKALWDRYNLTEDQQVEANRQILLQGARDKAAMERVVATVAGSIDRVDTIPAKDLAKLRMEVEANYGPQIKKTLQSKYGSNANIEAEYQRQLNAKLNSITGGGAAANALDPETQKALNLYR